MTGLTVSPTSEMVVLGTIGAGNDGHQILLDLLAAKDSRVYSLTDFVFSVPVALSGQNAVVDILTDPVSGVKTPVVRNTRIFLTPKSTTGYYGPKIIYYDRIHVSEVPDTTVVKGVSTTIYEILEKFNIKTGLGIKEEDVFNGPLPAADANGMVIVPLVIKLTSVVFYGSTKINAVDYHFGEPLSYVPAGTVFGTYCQGSNLMKITADGVGGIRVILAEVNSTACPLNNVYQPQGTLYAEYCDNANLMRVIADGAGGTTTVVAEYNSASCPIIQDPCSCIDLSSRIGVLENAPLTPIYIVLAVGDETTPVPSGPQLLRFHWPRQGTIIDIWAGLTKVQDGGDEIKIDLLDGSDNSLFTSPLNIPNGEELSQWEGVEKFVTRRFYKHERINITIPRIGDGTAAGLKIYIEILPNDIAV